MEMPSSINVVSNLSAGISSPLIFIPLTVGHWFSLRSIQSLVNHSHYYYRINSTTLDVDDSNFGQYEHLDRYDIDCTTKKTQMSLTISFYKGLSKPWSCQLVQPDLLQARVGHLINIVGVRCHWEEKLYMDLQGNIICILIRNNLLILQDKNSMSDIGEVIITQTLEYHRVPAWVECFLEFINGNVPKATVPSTR